MDKADQEDALNIWVIEPHQPLIFRDGRPFDLKPGVIAQSLPFPFPSTTTGGVRTQAGLNKEGIFDHISEKQLEALKNLKVRGPLLVQLPARQDYPEKQGEEPIEWFMPAPADALLLKPDEKSSTEQGKGAKARLKRLAPIENKPEILTDLTDICQDEEIDSPLQLVGMQQWISGKPIENPPRYWKWHTFRAWLLHPSEEIEIASWDQLGITGLPQEERVHVRMDGANHKGKDGSLFATRGIEFVIRNDNEGPRALALAVIVDKNAQLAPQPGFATLGSERRIVHWQNHTSRSIACPPELIDHIVVHEGSWSCRMILLTPASFKKGFYPTNIQETQDGVTPQLKAIAIQRPEVISGWDFTAKNGKGAPKRRAALHLLAPSSTSNSKASKMIFNAGSNATG